MTALAGGPADDTQILARPPAAQQAETREVFVRADGTLMLGQQPGSGYVVPPSLVRRGDGQVLQLTPLLYAVLAAIDGVRDVDEVAAVASGTSGRTLLGTDVLVLVRSTLCPLGLVLAEDGSQPPLTRANPLLALRPRYVVSDPQRTRRITAPFARLFNPVFVAVVTAAFAVIAYWVLFDKGLATAAYEAFSRPGLLLAVFAITVVSACFHEFGHAAALRRGGGTPGAMGAGLYLIWPAFYTDVTDSYRLGRGARIRTDLGGLYFNAIVALGMFGLWALTRWDGLLLVIAAQILQMIRQLPPLIRFDGYHLLADITGVPDLFHRIGPTLRSFLPRRWRPDDARALKPWVRVVVTSWVVVVVPVLLVSAVLMVVALPRILATTAHGLSVQGHLLASRAAAGDALGAAVKALAVVALVIPVGGVLFMLVRTARQSGTRVWRATAGQPRKRAAAGVATLAVLAGLGYAWWPHGNYRSIRPYERGTVQDALPAVVTAATGLQPGREMSATTVWADSGPLPTAAHPALAVVLSPRSGHGPTWVFPFNKPAPPGPGDNQAMAIVTRNGGTAYDVAFALVWASQDTVLDRNESYAFASCRNCRAVAVSFQVVLVVGHAHVVAPQNIAAAVGYHCIRCVTQALALQLAVSLPDAPTARTRAQLTQLWAEIAAFGRHAGSMSFAQIQARLAAYERRILALVRPDLSAPSAAPSAGPSSSDAPAPVTASTATAGSGPDTAAPGSPATTTDSSGTTTGASSSPSSVSTPSSSPSPTPTSTG